MTPMLVGKNASPDEAFADICKGDTAFFVGPAAGSALPLPNGPAGPDGFSSTEALASLLSLISLI
jgi:hypothetical protein